MIHQSGYKHAKAGVMLIDLVDREGLQLDWLEAQEPEGERQLSARLMAVLDAVNRELGRGTLSLFTV